MSYSYANAMASTSQSMPSYMAEKPCVVNTASTPPTSCFGDWTPPSPQTSDCFTKMKRQKPHRGGGNHHPMGRVMGHHKNNDSLFKYQQQTMGTMPQNCFVNTKMGDNQPAFVTDMMQDFQKAFGGMGAIFGAGQATYDPSTSTVPFTLAADAGGASMTSLPAYQITDPATSLTNYGTLPATEPLTMEQYLSTTGQQWGSTTTTMTNSQYPELNYTTTQQYVG
jgi:hypothetical protein